MKKIKNKGTHIVCYLLCKKKAKYENIYMFIFTKKQNKTNPKSPHRNNKPKNKEWGREWCKRGIEGINI